MSSASKGAMNRSSGNQKTGGSMDDTPGQVDRNVNAKVPMAYPHRLDSMGGSEHRGRNNVKRGG
jgi:hypothetical protein